jgi:Uma2 family endonuclease
MEALLEYDLVSLSSPNTPAVLPPSTVHEYLAMPEGAPYFQFINGECIEMAAPSIFHQDIVLNIGFAIKAYLRENSIGKVIISPVDVHFSDEEYYEPDIVVVVNDRMSIIAKNHILGAPDIVIEVLSPSTAYYDLSHKKTIYEQEGVHEYWLIYPDERRVEVLRNTDTGFIVHSQARKKADAAGAVTGAAVQSFVLAGFSIPLSSVFDA